MNVSIQESIWKRRDWILFKLLFNTKNITNLRNVEKLQGGCEY
jgi:hypothetical protein